MRTAVGQYADTAFYRLSSHVAFLVAVLILAHLALTCTERRPDTARPDLVDAAAGTRWLAASVVNSGSGVTLALPHPIVAACSDLVTVHPLALILMLPHDAAGTVDGTFEDVLDWHSASPATGPPPLAPAHQRALLQVFRL